jgi:hypothetical protein
VAKLATLLSMPLTLGDLPPTFTTRQVRRRGRHLRDLYLLRDSGRVYELSRGVFRKADDPVPTWPDLLAVGIRVPKRIVCCVSALAVRDPITPGPQRIEFPSQRPGRTATALFGYPIETVLAEKISTAVFPGAANTRVRDYADIDTLTGRWVPLARRRE